MLIIDNPLILVRLFFWETIVDNFVGNDLISYDVMLDRKIHIGDFNIVT